MFKKWVITWLFALIVLGCAAYHFPSEVPGQLEGIRSQVTPGLTSRKEVQQRLGDAFISNERVEIFRVLSGLDVHLGGPIVPIVWDTEEVIIYALVVYDKNNVVKAIDWDVFQHDPDEVLTGYQEGEKWRSASLYAGGFHFVSIKGGFNLFPRKRELLFAPPSETLNAFQTPPQPGMCALMMFFSKPYIPKEFYLNGERVGETPLIHYAATTTPPMKVFVKVLIQAGRHELAVKAPLKVEKFRRVLSCESGEQFFAYPRINLAKVEPLGRLRQWLNIPYTYEGEIIISSTPLEPPDDWKRLLFYNGKWFGKD